MQKFISQGVKGLIFFVSMFLFACISKDTVTRNEQEVDKDLASILADGKLVAVSDYNSTSYFLYKGTPMGYQYEMLRDLASYLGVKLELIVENDIDKLFDMLNSGKVDLIAANLTVTADRKEIVDFTIPHGETRQVLVQRSDNDDNDSGIIRNPLNLAGKVIYVQRSSAAAERVRNLEKEIGGKITLVELPNYDSDQLMEMVSEGEIDYVVCDETVAQVKAAALGNLDCETLIGFPQHTAWAVRKTSPDLLKRVNFWLNNYTKTAHYQVIKNKYYSSPRQIKRMNSNYFYVYTGKISKWDEYLKQESKKINWDWRLLASLVYQESRFNQHAVSNRGAKGLMQFMPATANYFGVNNSNPREQIEGGVRYLKWIEERFQEYNIPDDELVKFVLASYNAGVGHVLDARALAEKYGRDPNKWDDNVEYFLLNKSKYVNDPVVKYGKFKGVETYRYVSEILDRYQHYQNIIEEE